MVNEDNNFLRRRSMRSSELGDALLVGRGSKQPEEKSESQVTRAKSKNREYCQLFGLPASEELVEEYNCALQRKILLQGKMYVFSSYVCFYSNVFGYITKRSIALKEVTGVSKAKNVGFPNSIRIVHKGKQMFFTSFLSREDAYRLIVTLWYEASPYARLSGILPANELNSIKFSYNGSADSPQAGEEDLLSNSNPHSESGTPVKAHRKTPSNEDGSAHSDGPVPQSPVHGSPVAALQTSLSAGSSKTKSRTSRVLLERRHSISELNIKSSEILEMEGGETAAQEISRRSRRKSSRGSSSEGINVNLSPDEDEAMMALSGDNIDSRERIPQEKDKSRTNRILGTIKSERPPPVGPDMELICEAEFPICAYHFFATFLSDNSSFLKDFHYGKGDKNVNFSQWKQMDAKFPGYMRNMTFSTPLAFSIGPESTHCDQTQRYSFYQYETLEKKEELALVYETSQVNADVPYGDYFRVCTRWDIVDSSKHDRSVCNDEDIEQYTNHSSKFRVYLAVPFSKSTMLKGTIVQKTRAGCASHFEKLVTAIEKHIYSLLEGRMMGSSQEGVVDDKDLSARIPAEWRQQIQLMLNLQEGDQSGYSTPRDMMDYSYSSFTEHVGKGRGAGGRLTGGFKGFWRASPAMLLKGIVWTFTKVYTNAIVILLVCSLALNAVVLHNQVSRGTSGPADPMPGVKDHLNDNFWKAKRAHLTKEMELLEDYMELLRSQQELENRLRKG